MSNRPLVSVILPSYNHANFVTTAVESVLGQSFQHIELIVADDGSTDGTPELVAAIPDKRVKLVRLEQNRLRQTRNLAIKMAKGHYIAFQNSDDEWLQGKLQAQIDVLKKHKDVVLCFTGVQMVDENSQIINEPWAKEMLTAKNRSNLAWLRFFFDQGNSICLSSAVVRRDTLDAIGLFNGSLIQASDFDLWVRLATMGQFHFIEEKLTRMRIIGALKPSLLRLLRRVVRLLMPALIKDRLKALFEAKNILIKTIPQNLSARKASTNNRSVFEYAEILEHYSRLPILDMLPNIFTDIMPALITSVSERKAWLVKYAWSKNSIAHHLFANRLMVSLLEDDAKREEITAVFGAEIVREYITRRGELALRFQLMSKSRGI